MLIFFEMVISNLFPELLICFLGRLFIVYVLIFKNLCDYHDCSKANNCPFSNKITQDFDCFLEIFLSHPFALIGILEKYLAQVFTLACF